MKKIYVMLLMICAVCAFTACSDDDEKKPEIPVSGVKIPATAELGSEVTIGGTGFSAESKIFLRDEAGKATEATVKTYTKVDLIFIVPATLAEGTYTIVLKQDDEWDLPTKITIIPKRPIADYEVPTQIEPGKITKFVGTGFADDCELYLESEAGVQTKIEKTNTDYGVKFTLPEDFALGFYTLYVKQGRMWDFGTVEVVTPGPKPVKAIEIKTCYTDKNGNYLMVPDDEGNPTSEISQEISEMAFTYDDDGRIITIESADENWTYDYSEENKIKGSTTGKDWGGEYTKNIVYTLSNGVAQTFTQAKTYTGADAETQDYTFNHTDGYLTGMTGIIYGCEMDGDNAKSITYLDYDLMSGEEISVDANFSYATKFTNNTAGIDLMALLSARFGFADREVRLLGIAGKYPAQLPGKIVIPKSIDWNGDGSDVEDLTEEYSLTYQGNAKGQLDQVKIVRTDEKSSHELRYDIDGNIYYQTYIYTLIY